MTNQTTRRNIITAATALPLLPASALAAPTMLPLLPVSAFAALAEAPTPNFRKEGGGVRRHRPPSRNVTCRANSVRGFSGKGLVGWRGFAAQCRLGQTHGVTDGR